MPHQIVARLSKLILALFISLMFACATLPDDNKKPPVFPPPPDEARFIYERTLRVSSDVAGVSKWERFRMAVTGSAHVVEGLIKPFGVASHQGRIYVTDTVARVVKMFDIPNGKYLEFGNQEPGSLAKPLGIDVSSLGEVFVSDNTRKRIVVYDLEGKFLRTFGNPKELALPSGLAVSPDGKRVYVVETGGVQSQNHHLYIYDAQSGQRLSTVGKRGALDGEFNLPLQAAVAKDGTVYVVDSGNFRVQAFDAEGKFLRRFGAIGKKSGQFSRPKGIAVDGDGNIYVIDTGFGNFQIFNSEGKLLLFVGGRSERPGPANFMLPAGIDVDEDGRVYVVDQFFRKVEVFRPAKLEPNSGFTVQVKK